MFYDYFLTHCEELGKSPSAVLTELGISKGSLSRWREGGEPSNPTKKKLADYFGFSVKELSSPKKEMPTHVEGRHSDEAMKFAERFRGLTPEQWAKVREYAELLEHSYDSKERG